MRVDPLPMLALSALLAWSLVFAPASQAREVATQTKRPLIVRSHVAAPRTIGAFRLKEAKYDPAQKAAGAMFRYAAVPEPELGADVFVYPAGRQPQAEAIKRGMVDFREGLQAAQQAGYYRNLEISGEVAFPLSATASAAPAGDKLGAIVAAAEPVGSRIDMTFDAGNTGIPYRSRGYLFYQHLYFYKVRVSVPVEAMDAESFGEFADHTARTLVSRIDTINIGGCGDAPVYFDNKADTDTAAMALITQVAQRNQENCRSKIDEAELAKLTQGADTVTIEYSADEWGGQ